MEQQKNFGKAFVKKKTTATAVIATAVVAGLAVAPTLASASTMFDASAIALSGESADYIAAKQRFEEATLQLSAAQQAFANADGEQVLTQQELNQANLDLTAAEEELAEAQAAFDNFSITDAIAAAQAIVAAAQEKLAVAENEVAEKDAAIAVKRAEIDAQGIIIFQLEQDQAKIAEELDTAKAQADTHDKIAIDAAVTKAKRDYQAAIDAAGGTIEELQAMYDAKLLEISDKDAEIAANEAGKPTKPIVLYEKAVTDAQAALVQVRDVEPGEVQAQRDILQPQYDQSLLDQEGARGAVGIAATTAEEAQLAYDAVAEVDGNGQFMSDYRENLVVLSEFSFVLDSAQETLTDANAQMVAAQGNLDRVNDNPDASEADKAQAQLTLEEATAAQVQAQAELTEAQNRYDVINNGIIADTPRYDELFAALESLTAANEAAALALSDAQNALDATEEASYYLYLDIEALNAQDNSRAGRVVTAEANLVSAQAAYDAASTYEGTKDRLAAELATLTEESDRLELVLNTTPDILAGLAEGIAQAEEAQRVADADIAEFERIQQIFEAKQAELSEAQGKLSDLQEELDGLSAEMTMVLARVEDAEREVADAEAEVLCIQTDGDIDYSAVEQRLANAQAELRLATDKVAELTVQLASKMDAAYEASKLVDEAQKEYDAAKLAYEAFDDNGTEEPGEGGENPGGGGDGSEGGDGGEGENPGGDGGDNGETPGDGEGGDLGGENGDGGSDGENPDGGSDGEAPGGDGSDSGENGGEETPGSGNTENGGNKKPTEKPDSGKTPNVGIVAGENKNTNAANAGVGSAVTGKNIESLPNTGDGMSAILFGAGAMLVLAGGATVVATRRNRAA